MESIIMEFGKQAGPWVGLATAAVVAAAYLLIQKDLSFIKEELSEIKEAHSENQRERREAEDDLHSRVTENSKVISWIKGKINGRSAAEVVGAD